MTNFLDTMTLDGVKTTEEGYLIADAFTARTGIQRYAGFEVGRSDLHVVNVYRPPEEVFSHGSLRSFSHVPITVDHPTVPVTADNWKQLAVGEASAEVLRDGERLKIPLILKDKQAVENVKAGLRQLSVGYSCDLEFKDGTAPDGTQYQAIQKNIRANHVAIVAKGRAGAEFRIGDADAWGATPITKDTESIMNTRNVMVDGLSVTTTDQGAQAIEKLQADKAKLVTDNLALIADHNKALATKDAEIGELKAKLQQALDALPKPEHLDKWVSDRMELVGVAKLIAKDVKIDGLKDADIRKAVVVARLGDAAVQGVSDDVIAGMFKAISADAAKNPNTYGSGQSADPVRFGMSQLPVGNALRVNDSQAAYEKRISDAWKGEAAKA